MINSSKYFQIHWGLSYCLSYALCSWPLHRHLKNMLSTVLLASVPIMSDWWEEKNRRTQRNERHYRVGRALCLLLVVVSCKRRESLVYRNYPCQKFLRERSFFSWGKVESALGNQSLIIGISLYLIPSWYYCIGWARPYAFLNLCTFRLISTTFVFIFDSPVTIFIRTLWFHWT